MTNNVFIKVLRQYFKYIKMKDIKVPEFLDTEDKYNGIIFETDNLPKYELLFTTLLEDKDLPLIDILKLMKCIERDVILLHGIEEVRQVLELSEAFLKYMIAMTEAYDDETPKEIPTPSDVLKVITCEC